MSTFKNKNSLRTIKRLKLIKKNEAQPKFTGSYKNKRVPKVYGVATGVLQFCVRYFVE